MIPRKRIWLGFLVMILSCISGLAYAQEAGWPQELSGENGATVIIYQPQVEVFTGNSLEARAAVSVKMSASDNTPIFGAIWIKARLDTNRDTRTAIIRDIEVSDVRFADASDDQIDNLSKFIEASVGGSSMAISVDQLLSDLDAEKSGIAAADLKHTPPEIILSTEPAMLVSIDGEPVLQEIEGSDYEYVVNSAFLIARDGRAFYLYVGSNVWYQAGEVMGPWIRATTVPADVKSLIEPPEGDVKIPVI